jgi:hypothetical protein
MNLLEFRNKWAHLPSITTERQAAQEHYTDLCRVFGVPTPNEAQRPDYAFEYGVEKLTGGRGYADVWWRERFAWEYKRPRSDLRDAYRQLRLYSDALENPPLLIACDLQRFEVRTNFTGTPVEVHAFGLADLDESRWRDLLRDVFLDQAALKPGITKARVTEEAAARFGAIAAALGRRGVEAHRSAHFLMQVLFCLFAEDVGLLDAGLFTQLLDFGAKHPDAFARESAALFAAMRGGGHFALRDVPHFNGGLFATVDPVPLDAGELRDLATAATLDWGGIEPAIFGTLFERSLDPAKRAQLGAHYTGWHDIERVVEPVVMVPLRRRWAEVQAKADTIRDAIRTADTVQKRRNRQDDLAAVLRAFQEELARVRVLDPACGSGNFLYVTLAKLLDLERAVSGYALANGLPAMVPSIRPRQMLGMEVNEYARELAQVVVWIGYLQWMIENGFTGMGEPILEPLETIRLQDALLDRSEPGKPREADWPAADFIIGNPPFLGGNRIRAALGDVYLADLFAVYEGRVPRFADLVCYFFERARHEIEVRSDVRAGLLATNSIRGGVNREVLERIKQTGDVFAAWSDEPWIIEGAAVRISVIAFDGGHETEKMLDGAAVAAINADLTSSLNVTTAAPLPENAGIAFMGTSKKGPFEMEGDLARQFLRLPVNVNGRPNADVVKRWYNGKALTGRWADEWIVDFGTDASEKQASFYEAPFEYIRANVEPVRAANNRAAYRDRWWLLAEPRPALRRALTGLERYIATTIHAKYRLFSWLDADIVPDQALIVFARQDDYFFGVLHSRAHEDRPRYTPTTCFETFPLPWPPGREPWRDPRIHAIANAVHALDAARHAYLDPPDATPDVLKKRTLTNLYNERPAWLAMLHDDLDRAVWDAYGWQDPEPARAPEDIILARLLKLNVDRRCS